MTRYTPIEIEQAKADSAYAINANRRRKAELSANLNTQFSRLLPRPANGHMPFEGHRTQERVRLDEECGHASR